MTSEVQVVETEAMKVLGEVKDLMAAKARDYQSEASTVLQAMHYRRGIDTLHDALQGKLLRAQSLIEKAAANGNQVATEFESLEDSYKDLIAYGSFCVSWLRGKMEGQDLTKDIFNKPIVKKVEADVGTFIKKVETEVDSMFHKQAPKQ
jgi:hypothetical protein